MESIERELDSWIIIIIFKVNIYIFPIWNYKKQFSVLFYLPVINLFKISII